MSKFLGTISLFAKPEFEFHDKYVVISEEKKKSEVIYHYSEPRLLTTVNREINMPESVVDCTITHGILNDILKASSVLQVNDIAIRSNGSSLEIVALDKSDSTSNNYSIELGELPNDHDFTFYFKAENLKMLPGDYDVKITDKIISQFKKVNDELTYWIALESDSQYGG